MKIIESLTDEVFETEEDAKEIITELIDLYDDGGTYVYSILLNDKNIGHVELIELKDFFEVGYHIGEKYQNHGYATEALLGFLNYIKTNFNLDKVYGTSLKENVKSIKVMEKSGFKLEFEGKGKYQGKIEEIVRYSKSL